MFSQRRLLSKHVISNWALVVLPADTWRQAFNALCDIIDCMRATAFITVAGSTILKWVETFLDLYDISCWPLERKHKTPKAYGSDVRDTRIYESSVLHELICEHIASLSNPDTFSFLQCGLFKPQRATQNLMDWLAHALEVPASALTCKMAHSARHSVQVVCSVGDCILYKDSAADGDLGAGEVWINF